MTELYNIIAGLCSDIINSCQDDSLFLKYNCISGTLKKQIRNDIRRNLGFLFDAAADGAEIDNDELLSGVRYLKKEDVNKKMLDELRSYISLLKKSADNYGMIGLVQTLDEGLKYLLLDSVREYERDSFSVVLNTNRESTGIGLLPRCSCIWERKHRLSNSYNRLDNFMMHILLMENRILGELIDKHIFLNDSLFPGLTNSKGIRIAATPLRKERYFNIETYTQNGVRYCCIDYASRFFDKVNELIWKKICLAAERNIDIIVFPEAMGNPETEGFVSERLKALSENERMKMPSLIILPSSWKDNRNTVSVLDRSGRRICVQSKQSPFFYVKDGKNYLECIKPNMVVNILHCEGIGRMAILICKDFLTTTYMEQLMRCFKLTLIIVPSFSTGSYDFCQSFDLCAHDDCNVIWINSCAAMVAGKEDNFRNIGYVRKRIGRDDDTSQSLCEMPICDGAFSGSCRHDCFFIETIQGV